MCQSTARRTQTSWIDRERDFEAWLKPDQVRVKAAPYVSLAAARRGHVERVVAQLRTKGRVPRVCLYALTAGRQEPTHSLDAVRAFAERQGWQVGPGKSYTDRHGVTDLMTRPGWSYVRQQIRSGRADGVVALTYSVISPHQDEYERQLDWFVDHFGFIALVTPESTAVPR
ncbi:hypothetical protein [Streptomyces ochraceiscleroticus]|uniref:Resolvase/invertase-type recombinase catalytic domain-containing protein n=1 Tax=Streptomyces ochraceiscleroticus TaxID=47761 RepID=A0ABW1MUD4_9ACTN|nr:hypothetical protein [Streptomyces ochraceiscleroticus]